MRTHISAEQPSANCHNHPSPLLYNIQGGQMSSASGLLNETLGKLGVMLQSGGSKHMVYLIGFVVFSFMVIYWIMVSAEHITTALSLPLELTTSNGLASHRQTRCPDT